MIELSMRATGSGVVSFWKTRKNRVPDSCPCHGITLIDVVEETLTVERGDERVAITMTKDQWDDLFRIRK